MNKQIDNEKSSEVALGYAQEEMQKWYDEEFSTYKEQKEQEKKDFNEFAKIIINNTQEVKYMLANIYDNKSEKAVEVWNELKFEPAVSDIKLENENLVVTDKSGKQLMINFDELLSNIVRVLGEE